MIIALIFLVLMTLVGTAAMRTSTMQERMAGTQRDWNLAFQATEAALREAEDFILTTATLPDFTDTAGLYQINASTLPDWTGDTITNGNGFITYGDTIPGIGTRPRYYIEELSTVQPAGTSTETGTPLEEVFYYRVTAMGFGAAVDDDADPIASVVLSTVYRRQ